MRENVLDFGKCEHDSKMTTIAFSEFDESLRRSSVGNRWQRKFYKRLGPKLGSVLSMYRQFLPAAVCPLLDELVTKWPDMCEECNIKAMKHMTQRFLDEMTQHGVDDRRYLLDLNVLLGYDTVLNRTDPMATIRSEFGEPALPVDNRRMKYFVEQAIDSMAFGPISCKFDEFVKFRDAWANSGASTFGTTASVSVSGIRHGKRFEKTLKLRNKWFKALSLSDKHITDACLKGDPALVRPFRKIDEPGKARTVQCFDTQSIIRCSYLLEGLKAYNGSKEWTTLEMKPQEKAVMRRKLLRPGLTRICTDQSSFDVNQSKEMVLFAIEKLFVKLVKHSRQPDAAIVAAAELRALRAAFLQVGNDRVSWEKGVLSGMKLTALVDSLLNYGASYAVMEALEIPVTRGWFQGDDAVMMSPKPANKIDKQAISVEYAKLGLQVNPEKSWVAADRCEFLHEIYSDYEVFGFPARAAKSLIWKKPASSSRIGGAQSLNEDLQTMRVANRRGLTNMFSLFRVILSRVVKDPVNPKKLAAAWQTPLPLGGLGFGETGRVKFELESAQRRDVRVTVTSKVGYDIPQDLLTSAVRNRADAVAAMPGFVTTLKLERLPREVDIPQRLQFRFAALPRPRIQWDLRDYARVADPYLKKLSLERKLRSRDVIVEADLATRAFDGMVHLDRAVRRYNAMLRWSLTLEGAAMHAEPFTGLSRWADRVWAGYCLAWACGHTSKDPDYVQLALAFAAWNKVRTWVSPVQYTV